MRKAFISSATSVSGRIFDFKKYRQAIPSSKNDWETWLLLSRWVKEKTQINTCWEDFALEI